MSIADVYDAVRIITHGDGRTSPKHFDPCVLSAFIENHERMRDIYEQLVDDASEKAA
jgi:HD-GYP domain-containing protein (c-di-GMP phosphodiesterase class II)